MKKTGKHFLLVVLVFVISVMLCACASGRNTPPSQTPSSTNKNAGQTQSTASRGKKTVWLTETQKVYYGSGSNLQLDTSTRFSYDANGNTVTETHTFTEESGDMVISYTYDSYNNPIRIVMQSSTDRLPYDIKYTYDSSGNILTMEQTTDPNVDEKTWCNYTYDARGNLLKELHYSESGGLERSVSYRYDSKNNLVWMDNGDQVLEFTYSNHKEPDSVLVNGSKQYKLTYDNNGNATKLYKGDVLVYERTYKGDNCVDTKAYYSDGSLEAHLVGSYDSHGNLVQLDYYNSAGSLEGRIKWTYISIQVDTAIADKIAEEYENPMEQWEFS